VEEPGESRASAEILDLSDLLKRSLKKGKPAKRGSSADEGEGDDDSGEEAAPRPARKTARRTARKSA